MVAEAMLQPHVYVGEGAIERVTKFRYLGRILSQDDMTYQRVFVIFGASYNGLPSPRS
jgi:hypothetical protein